MEEIKNFKLEQIPLHDIVIVATSKPDCEMERTIVVEDYQGYGDWLVVDGGHCSCYGFEEVEWHATKYTSDEIRKLAVGWLKSGYGSEKIIAPLILNYVEDK